MPDTDLKAQTERAQVLLDLGRPQEAVGVLHQALAQSPGDARALSLLSLAHGNTGDHREALRWADQAVAAAPGGEWGHRLRAVHLLNLNAPGDALRAAEEAVRLEPQTPATVQTLVGTLMRLNRVRDAEAAAERLRLLAPEACSSHETLSSVALRRRKWREAEAHCRRALALRADSYPGLNNLGLALAHKASPLGRESGTILREAIDCLHRAIQSRPMEPLPRTNLKWALDIYLLSPLLSALFLFTLVLSAHIGASALPFFWLAMGLMFVVLLIVQQRRLRALPPAIRDFRRRAARRRSYIGHWWETRLIRQIWVRRRR